jgi:cation diffusion facilitator CzcD-associated flavoprotein CzcO
VEHLDVIVVGAGLSGVGAAHHLQTRCPWADYAVFESRDAIGGTWDLFRYPGIRSDSDMYTLGYSFRPWRQEQAIADGASILQYIRDTAAEAGIDRKIRFRQRIVRAEWRSADARWHVTAEPTGPDGSGTGETTELTCGFLFSCTGYYRYDRGYLPDFPGMGDYAGTLVHPQAWPDDLDCTGKRVVVIGSGATAVTLIPALARDAEHVTMLQRSPSYITSLPDKNPLAGLLRRLPGTRGDTAIRWVNAVGTQAFFHLSKRRPELVKRILRRRVQQQLPPGYDVDTHFSPTYDPWDQRLCVVPNGDLFAAIREGKASVVTDHVETFTEKGIRLRSGDELEADVVVTATGLDLLFIGGMQLTVDGEAVDPAERLTYKGMMLEGVPNMALAVGYTNASWTLKCDLTCDYVCRLLAHMHGSGLRQATPVNDGPDVTAAPLLGLSSGYVQRSVHLFPKQGSRFPWQVHQSYLRDYRAMKLRGVEDEAMVFSNPAPAELAVPTGTG